MCRNFELKLKKISVYMLPWYNQLLSLKHASWSGVLSLHIGQTFIALKQWYRRMLYFHIIYTSIQVNTVKSKGKTLQEVQGSHTSIYSLCNAACFIYHANFFNLLNIV